MRFVPRRFVELKRERGIRSNVIVHDSTEQQKVALFTLVDNRYVTMYEYENGKSRSWPKIDQVIIAANNTNEITHPAFYLYECAGNTAKIFTDVQVHPATIEDMFHIIMNGIFPWERFDVVCTENDWMYPPLMHLPGKCCPFRDAAVYTADTTNFGKILYRDDRIPEMVVAYFKINGEFYTAQVQKDQLGELNNVAQYLPQDIITMYRFGRKMEDVFTVSDFMMPDSPKILTRVKPLICFTNNPDTQRIMRLLYYNAISLYRYADGRITGHFNINALFTLIILNYIDLDSIIVAKELFKHDCRGEL